MCNNSPSKKHQFFSLEITHHEDGNSTYIRKTENINMIELISYLEIWSHEMKTLVVNDLNNGKQNKLKNGNEENQI